MIAFETAAPPPDAPSPDARRRTKHGAPFWLRTRAEMRDVAAIRDRMADDCLMLFDRDGDITTEGLRLIGWTRAQIVRDADAAQEDFVRRLGARRRAARMAGAAGDG